MKNKPLVVGHRGFSAIFPENTFAAFTSALNAGADMLEMDLHFTKDGKIVIMHDESLKRTCGGREGEIEKMEFFELAGLDCGSWFSREFSAERIPLLQDIMKSFAPRISLNLEIKPETLRDTQRLRSFFDTLFGTIREFHAEDRIILSSFDWKILEKVRENNSMIRLGVLNHEPEKTLGLDQIEKIAPYSYHINYKTLTADHVKQILARDLKIFTYTPNDAPTFLRLADLGVTGLITNEVELCRVTLDRA